MAKLGRKLHRYVAKSKQFISAAIFFGSLSLSMVGTLVSSAEIPSFDKTIPKMWFYVGWIEIFLY